MRDLIRDRLNDARVQTGEGFVVGAVTLIYNHHRRLLPERLTELQHRYHDIIISTVHSHLDHDLCLEVVVVEGELKRVQELGTRLIGLKGVQHGKLVMSAPDAYGRRTRNRANGNNATHHHPHPH